MNTSMIFRSGLLVAVVLLAACGGGGGGGTPNPPDPAPVDVTPDKFTFKDVTNAEPDTYYTATMTVAGVDDSVKARVCCTNSASVEFSIDGGKTWRTDPADVGNGDEVTIRLKSSDKPDSAVKATLYVGGTSSSPDAEGTGSDNFQVVTRSDETAPELAVHFPPPFSLSDQFEIVARGTVEDAFGMAKLEVGGEQVDFDAETGTWMATVTLVAGANAIEVVATDAGGNRSTGSFSVDTTATEIGNGDADFAPQQIVFDPGRHTLFAATYLSGVVSLNVLTGERQEVSGPSIGTGIPFGNLRGIAASADPSQLYVSDPNGLILSVDVESGDRAIVSDNMGTGAGPSLDAPFGLAYASGADRIFVTLNGNDTVMAVDPATGDRATVGDVARLHSPIVVRSDGSAVYIVDSDQGAVLEMQPDGSSTVISDGEGPDVGFPNGLALHNEALYVLDGDAAALIRVDLADKRKTIVADSETGGGPVFTNPQGLALDIAHSIAFLADGNRVFAIDLVTGERVIISSQ